MGSTTLRRGPGRPHPSVAGAGAGADEIERLVAESGRLGRAQLLAKRGSIGQMEISAELVPIPDASRMRRDFEFQQISANCQLWKI